MKRKVRLSELVIDPKLTRLRPINAFFVSRYRQAYRNGNDLGLIVADRESMRIVSGNHRVTAMLAEFGEDHEIIVELVAFASEAELLSRFAKENIEHGNPMTGATMRAIAVELLKMKQPPEEIARIFGVPIKRIVEWGDMTVTIIGGKRGDLQPIKRGADIAGKEVKREDYEEHWKADRGILAASQAAQLTRWIENGWINTEDEGTMAALEKLHDSLSGLLAKV